MKLGTIVYENEIYNLDYMTAEETKKLLDIIEKNKDEKINQSKNTQETDAF